MMVYVSEMTIGVMVDVTVLMAVMNQKAVKAVSSVRKDESKSIPRF